MREAKKKPKGSAPDSHKKGNKRANAFRAELEKWQQKPIDGERVNFGKWGKNCNQ